MQRFRKILVGVDLSHADRLAASELNPPTQEAVRRGIWLAGQLSAELTFFAAIDISPQAEDLLEAGGPSATHTVREEANAVLDELVHQAKEQGVAADAKLVFGKAWLEMIRAVLADKYDLVIVGTRDLGVAGRLLFGSTAMKLLRNCPCPVWVTKPDPTPETYDILVATDLGDIGKDALRVAVNGAQLLDARLHLLHAADLQIARRMWMTGLPDAEFKELCQKKCEEVEQDLHAQLAETDHRTLTHGVQVYVIDGPPDVIIPDAVQEHDIDLLVMGTVGRHGVPGLLIGNTAEQVLPQISCSVLALKPDDFQCPITLD